MGNMPFCSFWNFAPSSGVLAAASVTGWVQ